MAKTNILVLIKTSSEVVWPRRIYSSWSRRLEDVLKTSSEDEDERRLQDVFKIRLHQDECLLGCDNDFECGNLSRIRNKKNNRSYLLPTDKSVLNHLKYQWGVTKYNLFNFSNKPCIFFSILNLNTFTMDVILKIK